MPEARIGRVIVASLHQAIVDVLPQRLDFYENWLNSNGLREGTIGLAPLLAVISFLRTEGGVYPEVVGRAGEYAADWSVSGMSPWRRRLILAMPMWVRSRMALAVARGQIRDAYSGSKAASKLRKQAALVDVQGSVFCTVRETAQFPLCGYYASVIERTLKLFQVPAEAACSHCRGLGDPACEITVVLKTRERSLAS